MRLEDSSPYLLIIYKGEGVVTLPDGKLLFAVRRQQQLEKSVRSAQENDAALRSIQDGLANTDRHLTHYLTDHIDAGQIPQEAQKIQTELNGYEVALDDMKKKNEKDNDKRVLNQIDLTQRKLAEVCVKFRLFQKPANFDARLGECERVLAGVKGQLGVLDIRSVEQDVVQAQLEQCMKFYKSLSEVKSEVETVIKTGRQIVARQQTEQPKELDERLTALKLLYNQLGAQVTEGKQELEKSLKLSRKLRKEVNALTDWLAQTDAELTRRSAVEGLPADLEAEVVWAKAIREEQEEVRAPQLRGVEELAVQLKEVLRGKESLVDDKVSLLHCNWIAVTSRSEEWFNLLMDYQRQMETLDRDMAEIQVWMDGAETHMDKIDTDGPNDEVLKSLRAELEVMRGKVAAVQALGQELMATRGDHCQAALRPRMDTLELRFNTLAQRIAAGLSSASSGELAQYHSEAQIWLGLLEEEVQQGENLKEEDFTEDGDCEEGAVKDLLLQGEQLQKRAPDQDKREQVRLTHHQLSDKYNTVKDLRGVRRRKALAVAPQWYQYRRQADDLLTWLDHIQRSVSQLPDPPQEPRVKTITMTFR